MIDSIKSFFYKKEDSQTKKTLRVIKTARDEESINKAARKGFYPLVKAVEASSEIVSRYAITQNKKTGEISVIGDCRAPGANPDNPEMVIQWTAYYPYNFRSPYAAYLIPKDIKIGELVILEDLIEDLVGGRWNQGHAWRLDSCEAIWNGDDFEIQYNENDIPTAIG